MWEVPKRDYHAMTWQVFPALACGKCQHARFMTWRGRIDPGWHTRRASSHVLCRGVADKLRNGAYGVPGRELHGAMWQVLLTLAHSTCHCAKSAPLPYCRDSRKAKSEDGTLVISELCRISLASLSGFLQVVTVAGSVHVALRLACLDDCIRLA